MSAPRLSLATRQAAPVTTVSRMRDEIAFHAVTLLVVASVYGWSLFASPELRAPVRLIPFSRLILLHAGLLVIAVRLEPRRRWLPFYFVAQGILVFAINQTTSITGEAFGWYLYLSLAAQSIGLLNHRTRLAALLAAGYLTLALFHYVWLWGLSALPAFLLLAAPQNFFVIAFVLLFFREAGARRRALELLSELEIAHQDLESAHRQLAEYAARVEDLTLLSERQRLARELHDTLAQGLAGLILQLEAVDKQLTRARPERAQAITQQAMARARLALADARRAIDDLRASDSTSGSLVEMIRDEVARFTSATGISCKLELGLLPSIPVSLRDHAFRAVSEGLTNVARHARATHVWVHLAEMDGVLEIAIKDDGTGFDLVDASAATGHYGLIGLRERVRLVGGSLELKSASGQGTALTLRIPIMEGGHG